MDRAAIEQLQACERHRQVVDANALHESFTVPVLRTVVKCLMIGYQTYVYGCIMSACSLISAIPVAQVLHCWADWALPTGCHFGGWPLFVLLLCCAKIKRAVWASIPESILDLLLVQFLLLIFWAVSAGMT